jgi:hypothetical protein
MILVIVKFPMTMNESQTPSGDLNRLMKGSPDVQGRGQAWPQQIKNWTGICQFTPPQASSPENSDDSHFSIQAL